MLGILGYAGVQLLSTWTRDVELLDPYVYGVAFLGKIALFGGYWSVVSEGRLAFYLHSLERVGERAEIDYRDWLAEMRRTQNDERCRRQVNSEPSVESST